MRRIVFGFALLAGCGTNDPYGSQGLIAWDTFPFDGERTWRYVSSDDSIPYRLQVEIYGPGELGFGDNLVYTLRYTEDCFGADPSCVDGEVLRIIKWSSDPVSGVLIHGYGDLDGIQVLDPPLKLSADDVVIGDSWDTTTGGATWTSTYLGVEKCTIAMPVEWDTCLTFEVTTDSGEGYPLAGKWWSTKGNGVATMEIATETGMWQVSQVECVGADCGKNWW